MSKTESKELIEALELSPTTVFADADAFDKLIEHMAKLAADFKPDLSTDKGRKAIASFAFRFTRSKTAIAKACEELVDVKKEEIAKLKAQSDKMGTRIAELAATAREPLTKWEAEEAERKKNCEELVAYIEQLAALKINGKTEPFDAILKAIAEVQITDELGQYRARAEAALENAKATVEILHQQHKKAEADRIELERLQAESAAKDAELEKLQAELAVQNTKAALLAAEREKEFLPPPEIALRSYTDIVADSTPPALAITDTGPPAQPADVTPPMVTGYERPAPMSAGDQVAGALARRNAMTETKESLMKQFSLDEDRARALVIAVRDGHVPHMTWSI